MSERDKVINGEGGGGGDEWRGRGCGGGGVGEVGGVCLLPRKQVNLPGGRKHVKPMSQLNSIENIPLYYLRILEDQ